MFQFIAMHPVIGWALIAALLVIAAAALTVAIRAALSESGEAE